MPSRGSLGENIACDFLLKKGFKILSRNFRSYFGEIDIIAQDKNILVFVEVKTRWNQSYGLPEEAITPSKVTSIIKTGEYFKVLHPETPNSLRIDAVVIEMQGIEVKRIEHIPNLTL